MLLWVAPVVAPVVAPGSTGRRPVKRRQTPTVAPVKRR
jgi:hypothetical protein